MPVYKTSFMIRFASLFSCAFFLMAATLLISEEPVKPFTVVALPDTQCYCDTRHQQSARKWGNGDLRRYFFDQTDWVRDNKERLNISFLVHEGDIVQTDYPEEWAIARDAMSRLDGVVPYCLCLGNHDMGYEKTDKDEHSYTSATNRSTHFNRYFPRDKFSERPEFGDTHKPDEHDNSWYHFESAGLEFIILALECTPRDEVIEWANTVVQDHPEHRVIVLTHSYLEADNTRSTAGFKTPGNSGEELWQKLVKKHPNIFMVLCGHAAGEGLLTSIGDHGNEVHQVLSDYQIMNNGGESWLRYMVFNPTENKIEVFTYNPALDQFMEGESSRFDLEYTMSAAQ